MELSRARSLITSLATRKLVEIRRVEIVARDLAAHVEAIDRPPTARELETWLEAHAQVTEVSASDDALLAVLAEFFAPPAPPPTTVRHPDLERAILTDADPERAIAVYADWLQERNDPFGEQLSIGLANDERFARYLRDHTTRILGDNWRELAPLDITWRHGLIDKIRDIHDHGLDYRPVAPEHWAALLHTRSCEMLREICLVRRCSEELDACLAEHAPPGLMSVILVDIGRTTPMLARRPSHKLYLGGGDIAIGPDSISPELQHLDLAVSALRIDAPVVWNIRSLHVHAHPRVARALREIEMPRLERLTASGDASLVADFPAFTATNAG